MTEAQALYLAKGRNLVKVKRLCEWNGFVAYQALSKNDLSGENDDRVAPPRIILSNDRETRWARPRELNAVVDKYCYT